jgi:hypothetical protein
MAKNLPLLHILLRIPPILHHQYPSTNNQILTSPPLYPLQPTRPKHTPQHRTHPQRRHNSQLNPANLETVRTPFARLEKRRDQQETCKL